MMVVVRSVGKQVEDSGIGGIITLITRSLTGTACNCG